MKNRTDRMLLRVFLVSLLAYGILLSIYIQCIWKGTITSPILDALEQLFFWLAVMQCPSVLCSCCCAGEKAPALF